MNRSCRSYAYAQLVLVKVMVQKEAMPHVAGNQEKSVVKLIGT